MDGGFISICVDTVDSKRTNTDIAIYFAQKVSGIAPAYYVSWNRESRLPELEYNELTRRLSHP